MVTGSTVSGADGSTVTLSHGEENNVLLARQLAKAIAAHIGSGALSFLGSTIDGVQAASGNETLSGAAGASSVGAAAEKSVFDLVKTQIGKSVLTDLTKTVAGPAVTTATPESTGAAGSTITLSDSTKITFQAISELTTKHFG